MPRFKLIFIPILLFTIFSSVGYAQEKDRSDIINNGGNLIHVRSVTETMGSPYLNDDFLEGHIVQAGGAKTNTIMLRYDMKENQVQFMRDNKVFIADSKKINGFNIDAKNGDIVFRNGYKTDIDDINSNTLLRRVYNGDVKLLALHKAILLKNLATYKTAVNKSRYNVSQKYYLVTEDGTFHRLKSAKKDLVKNLPDHKNEIKEYASSNNLDFDKESDLVKILKHYDKISN